LPSNGEGLKEAVGGYGYGRKLGESMDSSFGQYKKEAVISIVQVNHHETTCNVLILMASLSATILNTWQQ